MAEILKDDVVITSARHNWDELLDGQKRKLTQGVDFSCQIASFRLQAYDAAKKKGKRAIVNAGKSIGEGSVILQAVPAPVAKTAPTI